MDGIWREGDRIRASSGMGYHDRVPDERLQEYADDEGSAEYDRAFAAAVLAVRRFERAPLTRFAAPASPDPGADDASGEVRRWVTC